jgi:hypothetical protein
MFAEYVVCTLNQGLLIRNGQLYYRLKAHYSIRNWDGFEIMRVFHYDGAWPCEALRGLPSF